MVFKVTAHADVPVLVNSYDATGLGSGVWVGVAPSVAVLVRVAVCVSVAVRVAVAVRVGVVVLVLVRVRDGVCVAVCVRVGVCCTLYPGAGMARIFPQPTMVPSSVRAIA